MLLVVAEGFDDEAEVVLEDAADVVEFRLEAYAVSG